MRATHTAALALFIALAFPATSLGAPVIPPDVSAANQYTEALPGAGGNTPTGAYGGEHPQSPTKGLGHSNAARLEALGPDGRAAADLAAAGVPNRGQRANSHQTEKSTEGVGNGESGARQVLGHLSGISDSGGMGAWLLALIVAFAVAAAAFAVRRRRATQKQG